MKKGLALASLCFFVSSAAFAAEAPGPGSPERYQKAVQLIQEDHIEEARHELLNLLKVDPSYAPAYYSLGVIQMKHEDAASAVDYFRKSVQLGADGAMVHYLMAAALVRKGEVESGEKSYLLAIQKNPLLSGVHHDLGMLYYITGKFEKAAAALENALDVDPRSTQTMLLLGMAYIKDERPQNAVGLVTSLREARDEIKAYKLESLLRESQKKKSFVDPDKQYLTPGGRPAPAKPAKSSSSSSKGKMSITGNATVSSKVTNGKATQSQSTRKT